MDVDNDMHMINCGKAVGSINMKKIMVAGLCGLCMMAACAFASAGTGANMQVAGSGSGAHIKG